MAIVIPYNFTPREYQKGVYNCLSSGYNRAIIVMHRRAGKDKVCLNIMAREAFKRVGSYFYILPYYTQARRIVWEGLDKDGFRNIDHFPQQLVRRRDNQQMTLELVNGSFVRFLGSDNIDSVVGTNPIGVIFSEFSLHKIEAWNYLRPILIENGGWALFNGTPRGKNHMWKLLEAAKDDPEWYSDVKTIDDTGVMTAEQVENEIKNGMPRALAMQEFYCSFDAAMTGAYYGDTMAWAEAQNRLTQVQWNPNYVVNTAWDLGVSDTTVVWMFQVIDGKVNVIDLMHDNGRGLEFYIKALNAKPYVYGYDIMPHDVRVREFSTGESRLQTLYSLGRTRVRVAPRTPLEEGIHVTRSFLARCWFDERACEKGLEALKQYRAMWDATREVYGAPIHDWSSHFADAFRILATGIEDESTTMDKPAVAVGTGYNPLLIDDAVYRYQTGIEQTLPRVDTGL